MESVDFGRNLCEKYSSLPLIGNGNVFMFGRLFYKECIINEKSFSAGKETQLLIFIRVLPHVLLLQAACEFRAGSAFENQAVM